MEYSKEYINNFLKECFFATLSWRYELGIISQLMIFNHTYEGYFYLISEYEKELFKSISNGENSQVSILIYKEEENLESIGQANIIGNADLIDQENKDSLKNAYKVIGEKSPLIKNLCFFDINDIKIKDREENKIGEHTIIKVKAETISYISFKDIRGKKNPTVIQRISNSI